MQGTLESIEEEACRVTLRKDCFQTPDYATRLILPLLARTWRILDPCAGKGNIVRCLRENGFTAVGSDLNGESEYSPFSAVDFLNPDSIDYSTVDCIVTNPPYSCYGEFMARCVEIGLPYALLVPDSFADSLYRFQTIQEAGGVNIIYPPNRIAYETPTGRVGSDSKPQMLTVWITNIPLDGFQDCARGEVVYAKEML